MLDSRFAKVFNQGHVPGNINVPFTDVLNADRSFKNDEELLEVFKEKGQLSDPKNDPVILTCQRAITACILDVAL
jgi:thiosulfate/3-mercaptopyruvate sulfurtransferase